MTRIQISLLVLISVILSVSCLASQVISRTADSDTIRNDDGTFQTTYYAGIVNYLASNGTYQPYDFTISSTSSLAGYNSELNTEQLKYKVFVKNNSNLPEAVRFEKDGYFFTYDLSGGKMQWAEQDGFPTRTDTLGSGAPSNSLDTTYILSSRLFYYPNAFYNTNVTYSVNRQMLKETFILGGLPSYKDYNYLEYTGNIKFNRSLQICTTTQCYTPSGNLDDFSTSGEIYFKDINNVTIFYLKAPTVTDSAGHKTLGIYKVRGSDAQMNFALRVNKTYLSTATYPVYIDPTVTYNFSATYQGINMFGRATNGFGEDCSVVPPTTGSPLPDCIATDITSNVKLDAYDNNILSTNSYDYEAHLFYANITGINLSTITMINWTHYYGQTSGPNSNLSYYLWNNTAWELMRVTKPGLNINISVNSSNIIHYNNSNLLLRPLYQTTSH